MNMRTYAIRIVLMCMVLIGLALYGVTHAADVGHPLKPTSYTLVIITETYHGTSSVTVPMYPTKAACKKAEWTVHAEGNDMRDEKDTDYLYTDTYCVPVYGAPHGD